MKQATALFLVCALLSLSFLMTPGAAFSFTQEQGTAADKTATGNTILVRQQGEEGTDPEAAEKNAPADGKDTGQSREASSGGSSDTDPSSGPARLDPRVIARLQYKRKDPFLAGLLSVPMWGLGHFYAGEYTRGSLLVFGDLVYKGLLLGLVIKINNKYTIPGQKDSVAWDDLSTFDRSLTIGYLVSYLGITLWAMFDAVHTTEAYNKRFEIPGNFKLGVESGAGKMGFRLGWEFRF